MFKRIQRLGSVPTKYQVAIVLKDFHMDLNVAADIGVLVTRGPHRCQSEVVSGTGLWVWPFEYQKKKPIMLNCTLYFDKEKNAFQSKTCKITVKQIQGSSTKTIGEISLDLANYATGKVASWEMSSALDKCKGVKATLNYTIHARPLPAGTPGAVDETMSTLEGMEQSYFDPDSIADFGHMTNPDGDDDFSGKKEENKSVTPLTSASTPVSKPDNDTDNKNVTTTSASTSSGATPSTTVVASAATVAPAAKKASAGDSDSDSDSDLEDPDVALASPVSSKGKGASTGMATSKGVTSPVSKGKSNAFDMEDSDEEEEDVAMGFGKKQKSRPVEEKSEMSASPVVADMKADTSAPVVDPVATSVSAIALSTPTKTTSATPTPTAHRDMSAPMPQAPTSPVQPYTSSSASYLPTLTTNTSASLPTPASPTSCKACAATRQEVQARVSNLQQHVEELEQRLGAATAASVNDRLRAEAAEEALSSHDQETKSVLDELRNKYEGREEELRRRAERAEEKLRSLDETYVSNIEHLQQSYEEQKQRFRDAVQSELTLMKNEVALLRDRARQFDQINDLKVKKAEQKLMAQLAFYHGQLMEHEDLVVQVKETYSTSNRLLMDNVEQLEMTVADLRKQEVNQTMILREQDRKLREYEAALKTERMNKQTLAEHINTLELQLSAQSEQALTLNNELEEVKAENLRLKKFIKRMGY